MTVSIKSHTSFSQYSVLVSLRQDLQALCTSPSIETQRITALAAQNLEEIRRSMDEIYLLHHTIIDGMSPDVFTHETLIRIKSFIQKIESFKSVLSDLDRTLTDHSIPPMVKAQFCEQQLISSLYEKKRELQRATSDLHQRLGNLLIELTGREKVLPKSEYKELLALVNDLPGPICSSFRKTHARFLLQQATLPLQAWLQHHNLFFCIERLSIQDQQALFRVLHKSVKQLTPGSLVKAFQNLTQFLQDKENEGPSKSVPKISKTAEKLLTRLNQLNLSKEAYEALCCILSFSPPLALQWINMIQKAPAVLGTYLDSSCISGIRQNFLQLLSQNPAALRSFTTFLIHLNGRDPNFMLSFFDTGLLINPTEAISLLEVTHQTPCCLQKIIRRFNWSAPPQDTFTTCILSLLRIAPKEILHNILLLLEDGLGKKTGSVNTAEFLFTQKLLSHIRSDNVEEIMLLVDCARAGFLSTAMRLCEMIDLPLQERSLLTLASSVNAPALTNYFTLSSSLQQALLPRLVQNAPSLPPAIQHLVRAATLFPEAFFLQLLATHDQPRSRFLLYLIHKGWEEKAVKLHTQPHQNWEGFYSCEVEEQLWDLHLCTTEIEKSQPKETAAVNLLWKFCNLIANSSAKEGYDLTLGMVLYLATNNFSDLMTIFEPGTLPSSSHITALKEMFHSPKFSPSTPLMAAVIDDQDDQTKETTFSIAVARVLMIEGSNINMALLPWLLEHPAFKTAFPEESDHLCVLNRALASFQRWGGTISTTLSEVSVPRALFHPGQVILRKVLNKPAWIPATNHEGRIAILSTFFTRRRQENNILNCFSTALSIELHASPLLWKYLIKDYISLITQGAILRPIVGSTNAMRAYPAVFPPMQSENHFLACTLEHTIAQLSASSYIKRVLQKHLQLYSPEGYFYKAIQKVFSRHAPSLPVLSTEKLSASLSEQCSLMFSPFYDPHFIPHGKQNKGAWVLAYRSNSRPVNSLSEYQGALHKVLEQTEKQLLAAHPVPDKEMQIRIFFTSLYTYATSKSPYFQRLQRSSKTPWAVSGGGNPNQIRTIYFNLSHTLRSHFFHVTTPMEWLEEMVYYMKGLPELITQVMQNESLLLPFDLTDKTIELAHSANFYPQQLQHSLKTVSNIEELSHQLLQESSFLRKQQLDKELQATLIERFSSYLPQPVCEKFQQHMKKHVTTQKSTALFCKRALHFVHSKCSSQKLRATTFRNWESVLRSELGRLNQPLPKPLTLIDMNYWVYNHQNSHMGLIGSLLTGTLKIFEGSLSAPRLDFNPLAYVCKSLPRPNIQNLYGNTLEAL